MDMHKSARNPYLAITLRKSGVYAQDPNVAWQRYRDQLAQLHNSSEHEQDRQRMAWGAYQQLLAQNHADMYRSQDAVEKGGKKPLGAAFSHARAETKRKGKAGNKKLEHVIAQRYLSRKGHGKMGDDT